MIKAKKENNKILKKKKKNMPLEKAYIVLSPVYDRRSLEIPLFFFKSLVGKINNKELIKSIKSATLKRKVVDVSIPIFRVVR